MQRNKRPRVRIRDDISAEELRQQARSSQRKNAVRLLALARVAEGVRYTVVAEASGVSLATIYNWIKCLNEQGLDAFQSATRRGRPSIHHLPSNLTPEKVSVSAPETVDPQASQRLLAISMLLRKERPCGIARALGVSPSTINSWIKRVNQDGVLGLIRGKERAARVSPRMRVDISSRQLRRAATIAKKRNQVRAARRLTAVAFILDGMKLADVAERMSISRSVVSKWCQALNKEGIKGLFLKSDNKYALR